MMGRSPAFLPVDRLYTRNHMWLAPLAEGSYRCGLSAYAVRLLGDLRSLQWSVAAPVDVDAGQRIGLVEASKATSDLYAPVAGRIETLNPDVPTDPTLLNSNLYDAGWLLTIQSEDATLLMQPEAYQTHLEAVWPLAQRLLKGQFGRQPEGET